jgi:hypothetical protein
LEAPCAKNQPLFTKIQTDGTCKSGLLLMDKFLWITGKISVDNQKGLRRAGQAWMARDGSTCSRYYARCRHRPNEKEKPSRPARLIGSSVGRLHARSLQLVCRRIDRCAA